MSKKPCLKFIQQLLTLKVYFNTTNVQVHISDLPRPRAFHRYRCFYSILPCSGPQARLAGAVSMNGCLQDICNVYLRNGDPPSIRT
jgi:hypothetical protein